MFQSLLHTAEVHSHTSQTKGKCQDMFALHFY